jgi:hypothetical protein
MNRTHLLILTAATLTGTMFAQTSAETQAGASASQGTSVQANRSGAQVQSQTEAQAAAQGALSNKTQNTSAGAAASNQLASGTSFHTTLEKPVDARKCKPGDEVIAKNTENVKSHGQVVIPKGSKIIGHVTQVQAASKGQSASQLGIAFDRAILKSGQEVPMNASIQALAASQQSASADLIGDTVADGAIAGGGAVASGRGAVGGAGGLVGGTTRTVGTTGGSLVNTAGSATGRAGTTLNGAGTALNANGQLLASSQGVAGLKGLSLDSATSTAAQGSVIASKTGNVHLDSGTQMILRAAAR